MAGKAQTADGLLPGEDLQRSIPPAQ